MNPLIPKILHQIWIGPKPAPTNLMKTWKEKHPDFEYILWTENEIIKRKLELKCIDKIMMINEINGKADIIRWEILYQYGGYFVDADSICIEPFDEIFYDKPAFATFENENVRNGLVATGTMGFIPKYSLCLDIINWINSNESTYVILNNRAWYSVGPALLTKMLETGKYTDFSVFPSHYFLPVHFTGSNYEGHKKVYGYQEWGTAKNSYDTMNNIVLPKELLPPPIDNWVSILITSYNTIGFFINECLTSIKNQTGYFGIELVWINDGSNDESTYILERELMNFEKTTRFTKVVYHKNDINIGHAKSLNKGISLCTNELIIKMDSDDIMVPDRILRQISFMKENPNIVICGSNIQLFENLDNKKEKKIFREKTNHPLKLTYDEFLNIRPDWFMNHPTLCYRKSAIESINGYTTDPFIINNLHEDYDLEVRILKKYGIIINLPENLVLYRIHENQLTNLQKLTIEENAKIKKYIIG